jgi:two-component system cell cycle sensor histidine kinase/response regulator CckA
MRASETILIVEDAEPVLLVAKRILCKAGYLVLTASAGAEAVMTCEEHQGTIHLLLTDVVLPRTNGKELFEYLSESRPGLKVLYMSGYPDNVIARTGIVPTASHFMAKPFTAERLTGKVREVLDSGCGSPGQGV